MKVVSNLLREKTLAIVLIKLNLSTFGGKNAITGCIYHPPDTDDNVFYDALSFTVELISKKIMHSLLGILILIFSKVTQMYYLEFLNILHA